MRRSKIESSEKAVVGQCKNSCRTAKFFATAEGLLLAIVFQIEFQSKQDIRLLYLHIERTNMCTWSNFFVYKLLSNIVHTVCTT